MPENNLSLCQLLASGQWEEALKWWGQSYPPQILSRRLATILREIMPSDQHSLLDEISTSCSPLDDDLRWRILNKARIVGFNTSTGALALALFWSEGSMSPPELAPVYPDPQLSSDMLLCALVLTVSQLADSPVDGVQLLFNHYAEMEKSQ